MAEISAGLLWDLFKHARSWLVNLNRAGERRKRESKEALRGIILASRQTAVYLRQLEDSGRRDHEAERRLSTRWTELGFELEDLGIGKLAKRFTEDGLSVMLAAGDTFRAAAVEQLQAWGDRNDVPVIAQQAGADPAAVIFDAMDAARARNIDVLLADTAGRLQSQTGLMDELAKVKRVISRRDETAPHEIMLVLDASQGQNALVQAEKFHEALGLTGLTVTKLDGSAKGGILLAIADRIGVPVRFIGIGEAAEDMQPFSAEEFADALVSSGAQDETAA